MSPSSAQCFTICSDFWPLGDFTLNSCRLQCRAFTRALQTEKLKAPLFTGPIGMGFQMIGALHLLILLCICVYSVSMAKLISKILFKLKILGSCQWVLSRLCYQRLEPKILMDTSPHSI